MIGSEEGSRASASRDLPKLQEAFPNRFRVEQMRWEPEDGPDGFRMSLRLPDLEQPLRGDSAPSKREAKCLALLRALELVST